MAKTEHTPTPWDRKNTGTPTGNPGHLLFAGTRKIARLVELDEENYANAEFIIRACNAHDDLLTALRQTAQQLRDLHAAIANEDLDDVFADDAIDMLSEGRRALDHADAAIAKSTGKK
jgi:hypothetical protein